MGGPNAVAAELVNTIATFRCKTSLTKLERVKLRSLEDNLRLLHFSISSKYVDTDDEMPVSAVEASLKEG